MSTIKMLKKIHQQGERRSLVKELINVRAITPLETRVAHPLQALYPDTNPPPQPVDQFAPLLARKLQMKKKENAEITKPMKTNGPPPLSLHNSVSVSVPKCTKEEIEDAFITAASSRPTNERKPAYHANSSSLRHHLDMESAFDKIATGAASTPLNRLMENTLQNFFNADQVFFFHEISSIQVLYCPSTANAFPHGCGLVGYCQFIRETIHAKVASEHVAYSDDDTPLCPPTSHVLVFPLYDLDSHVHAIVEVVRGSEKPVFSDEDLKFVEYFQMKCGMYSRWLFQPVLDDTVTSNLMMTCRLGRFVEVIREKLSHLFSCRSAEVWRYNPDNDVIEQFVEKNNKPVSVLPNEAGIPGFCMRQQIPVSCVCAQTHSSYNQKADGSGELSCLLIPVRDPDTGFIYAIGLRGKRVPSFFTDDDEKILARIAPAVISSLLSSLVLEKNFDALDDSLYQQKKLRTLLDVAEALSGQLRMDVLIPNIMQRACDLVKADRCSLFMANEARDKLITTFSGGLANAIEIPFNAGIVGVCATSGNVLNIPDAYEDPRFNRATDLKTGYRTSSILCVPIFDEKGDVRGVTEMINKFEGAFTQEDEKLIQIFNVYCGISIENARLYRASIDLSLQLRSFLDISVSLSQPQTIKKLIEDILRNTRKVLGAVKAMMYMLENNEGEFIQYAIDEDIEAKMKNAQRKKALEQKDTLTMKRNIISKLMHGQVSDADQSAEQEEEAERRKLVAHVINKRESVLENDPQNPEMSLICVPILSSERAVMGAVLMQWKKTLQKFTYDDQKLLESYSVFLSLSLERSRLKNIAALGSMGVEMQQYIEPTERDQPIVPAKLELGPNEKITLLSINFDSTLLEPTVGTIRCLFNLFAQFKLMEHFKIKSSTLFCFFYGIKQTYNAVAYHNWAHAIATTQYLVSMILMGHLGSQLTPFEILALLVASICHDAGHDGFSNAYNANAEGPLNYLFKNQSVLETHHCSIMIDVLTKDECNIFSNLNEEESIRIWPLLIDLVMATDMAKHFNIIDEMNNYFNKHSKWSENDQGRNLLMRIMIKCADLNDFGRPFELASKNKELATDEFFRQGDLEHNPGVVYNDSMHDRNHIDVNQSVPWFYGNVAMPLFECLSKCVSGLEPMIAYAKSNLSLWTEILEKEKQKENELKYDDEEAPSGVKLVKETPTCSTKDLPKTSSALITELPTAIENDPEMKKTIEELREKELQK